MKRKHYILAVAVLLMGLGTGCADITLNSKATGTNTSPDEKAESSIEESLESSYDSLADSRSQSLESPVSDDEGEIQEYQYPDKFSMGDDLRDAIESVVYADSEYQPEDTESYKTSFIRTYCQNTRYTNSYLEKIRQMQDGIMTADDVSYMQYSMTGKEMDFTDIVPAEGIDINRTVSYTESDGVMDSYEVISETDDEITITADITRTFDGSTVEQELKAEVVLVKNAYSCFDGYSIKTVSSSDVTPPAAIAKTEMSFSGYCLGKNEDGTYTFGELESEGVVPLASYVAVDLSENPGFETLVSDNPDAQFIVTFDYDVSMGAKIEKVKAQNLEICED